MRRSRSRRPPAAIKPRVFGLEKAIIGLLILATFAFAVIFMAGESLIHSDPKTPPPEPARIALPPSPMEPAALAALEAFFEAPDLTAKATLVRDSARVRPMMENYHDQRGHSFPTLGRVSPGHAASFDGTPMVLFEVEPFSGPRYPVAVVWDGYRFGVDWESLTAYGTMDWSEFLENQPTAPQILRVFLTTAGPAERIPGLPPGHVSYLIEHRDHPQPAVAVAEPSVAADLAKIGETRRVPVTIETSWKPLGSGKSTVPVLSGSVAVGWSR